MTVYRTIIATEDRQVISARNFELKQDAEELAESWFERMLGYESDYGTLAYIAVQKIDKELKTIGVNIWETVSEFEY
jgi:hypothetical protein